MTDRQSSPGRESARIVAGFAVFSLLWIFVSDRLILGVAGDDLGLLSALQSWKGAVYLLVVSVVLYVIIRRVLERQSASEAALGALNVDLENRVAERTAQLESANRELEAFSYSVSHDLKAPLRGVDGYSQILLLDYADRLDDEGRLLLGNIRNGVAQMHALIEDMLAYSRIERRALEAREIPLDTIASQVVEQRDADPGAHSVAISCALEGVVARIDRDGFALALRNLLENAIKFSRGQEVPRIEIGAEDRGDRVLLFVRDNGIGFDMQYHDRIFDIFQRLHRAEDYPGTGVGLALVKKAVCRMGGRVWAQSAPGEGATFYMELPK
ncbi:MAG: hypothetical protein LPJ87_03855 [Zoogloeaceae bacterium]|nr:hypothetical protein [Zoogloeaceae bacterium]